ncbi:hypothetical protein PAXRUDRAFT_18944 [Paxillus rubicundulus Ve08.2h10]|uniref:Uncharacterized protein n=1 Tax=Paxillus rubicundulus Ve08.2h10 TaxID=930991 RepID=A0A0D0BW03_9AGAM|nr:hypothetical protein PAXRUDRAFT_18944 [Paxillus rubicundulus Ve08.2h10]
MVPRHYIKCNHAPRKVAPGEAIQRVARNESSKGDDKDSQTGAPPSKRTKAAPHSTSTSQCSSSRANKKYIKDDLPPGSTVDNIWRQVFILTLAHFTGGYDNPWTIPSDQFTLVL